MNELTLAQQDAHLMGLALKQAEAAGASGQTPFGAVVVILSIDGRINEPVKWNAPGFYRAVHGRQWQRGEVPGCPV